MSISEVQGDILRLHYGALDRTVTATQLARALNYSSHSTINGIYGRLAHSVAEYLGYRPEGIWLGTLVSFEKIGEWHWTMHANVAEALETLGWVSVKLPSEIDVSNEPDEPNTFYEGASRQVTLTVYERNPLARQRCLEAHGDICCICRFDFDRRYYSLTKRIIHVHHEVPLATVGQKHHIDPVTDMKPVCPNCHAVIHSRTPPYTIEEVRNMLR